MTARCSGGVAYLADKGEAEEGPDDGDLSEEGEDDGEEVTA